MKNDLRKYDKTYQASRIVLTPLFKMAYRPMILNKENIPKNGPAILCGNHLHVWDQVPVICSTDRVIHWMAKKEYFESKLAWMYKLTGCIPVDREGDASIAKNSAEEYLKDGAVVGIFPEGTRNQYQVAKNKLDELYSLYPFLKNGDGNNIKSDEIAKLFEQKKMLLERMQQQEQVYSDKGVVINKEDELLTFHFGAVSMARKTDAFVVPFAVNGNYKMNNDNLIVNFGEAYKVESDDLEFEKDKLQKKVAVLIKENKKFTRKR